MVAILGMGNPLLDISCEVDQALMDEFGLENGGIILAEDKHQPLFPKMQAMANVQYIAGGATQNTIRVAQWMLQEAGATAYMGCVGKDANADTMKAECDKAGVNALYMVDPSTPTGSCACCILGKERSLCTNLHAANNYKETHLQEPANWAIASGAKIIYSAGFFITVSPASIKLASMEAAKNGNLYCMNLSAPFIVQVPPFKGCLNETMPYVDFLFGNETEAQTWADVEGWDCSDIAFIATRLSLIPSKKSRKRTVVITQGKDPTIVAINGLVREYAITPLAADKIVDTNGAGDAYVGGFLAGLSKGLDMEACCKAGAYSASVIVQQSGCTYPAKPEYTF
jgi:adenosine kinase